MSELCLSTTPMTTQQFSTLLLSELILLFSFILAHPLYFSYFVFLSPYLLNLLSFLSPLFIATSLLLLLLLLGFLPFSPSLVHANCLESSESKLVYLRSKTDDEGREFHQFAELEVYNFVFEISASYAVENSNEVPELRSEEKRVQAMEAPDVLKSSSYEGSCESKSEVLVANVEEKTVEIAWEEIKTTHCTQPILKELEDFENMNSRVEEKKFEVTIGDRTNTRRFDANVNNSGSSGEHTTSKFLESPNCRKLDSSLGRCVSVRKERDWKRTLACKLLEERHNVDGGEEGLDLLWETYEMDSSDKVKPKSNISNNNNKKKMKSELECYEEGEEDDEGEELDDGQFCCVQAMNLSPGKKNLGMGRISKAIKGIGWLHAVRRYCQTRVRLRYRLRPP